MSGGIDSTVAVLLLRDAGYEPFGVTLVLQASDSARPVPVGVCGYAAAEEAAAVAAQLGIAHEVVDARGPFTQNVLRACWDVFAAGGTPNPCVFCNARVRFGMMVALARERGVDLIATGHYARLIEQDGVFRLARGKDTRKDQSYFLHGVAPELFPHILFPLGGLTKPEVRAIARERGLKNAEHPESQDVCFAGPDGHFAEKLRRQFDGQARPGIIRDEDGHVLGRHSGIHQFTIGQRKGLGFATGTAMKICAINPENGDIVVSARREAVYKSQARAARFHWLGAVPPVGTRVEAQVRYRQKAVGAILTEADAENGLVAVNFEEPVFSVTAGQSLVLYDGDFVLGGGCIL